MIDKNRDDKGKFIKGHKLGNRFKKGLNPWNLGKRYKNLKVSIANKGKHYSPETEFKKGEWKFKGTRNEYRNLHKRITRKFGKPDVCEHCGKAGFIGKQIHWANKKESNYTEDRKDWLRLCAKCHFIYDERLPILKENKNLQELVPNKKSNL